MTTKGIWLSILCVVSMFLALPFVFIYCGAKGKGDLYNFEL
jgi:hypothetical protein